MAVAGGIPTYAREALVMRLDAFIKGLLANFRDSAITAVEDLLWREASQPAVVVLKVVPVNTSTVPLPDMRDALDLPRVAWHWGLRN